MAENRSISREEHRRNRAYKDKLPPFRSDMSEEDLKKWFSRARATGMFGKRYRTLDQLKRAIKYLSEGGFKPAEIRRLLQFQSTNPVIVTKKDKGATLNNRAIRQTIEADIRNDIDAIYGAGSADQLEAGLRRDWAKVRKEASAIDKLTGQVNDMGHFDEGQLLDPEVQALENRIDNQRAGAAGNRPNRYSLPTIREISTGGTGNTRIDKGETAWNRFALSAGAPRRSGLSTVFPGDVAKLADVGYISEDELPVLARSLEELESQGYNRAAMISHIKEVGTTDPKSLAAAGSVVAGPMPRNMPKGALKALGIAAGALPVVGAAFDAGGAVAGTQEALSNSSSSGDKLAGALDAISGFTGLASLSPATAIPMGLTSIATGLLSAAVRRRAGMDKPAPPRQSYTGPTPRLIPTVQRQSKPIGNGKGGLTKPRGPMPRSQSLDLGNEVRYFWGQFNKIINNVTRPQGHV